MIRWIVICLGIAFCVECAPAVPAGQLSAGQPSAAPPSSLFAERTYTVYVRYRSKPGAKWGSWNPLRGGRSLPIGQATKLARKTMDNDRNAQCKVEPD